MPSTTPPPTPHQVRRRVRERVVVTSPAPSACPVMACAAIASASRVKTRKPHRAIASWWVAICAASLRVVTAYAVTSSAARRVSVRTTRATPARAAARTPPRSGRRAALSRRAARTTTASNAAALPTWAITEPRGGARDAEASDRADAEDEHEVEHDVGRVAGDGDHERGAGVLEAAQDPGRGQHDEQRHDTEEGRRRYATAWSATSGSTPKVATSGAVASTPTTVSRVPRATASHTPSMPWVRARRASPAPR